MLHSFALSFGRVDWTFGTGQNNSVTNLVNIVCDDLGDRGLTLEVDFWKECVEGACQLSPREVHVGLTSLGGR